MRFLKSVLGALGSLVLVTSCGGDNGNQGSQPPGAPPTPVPTPAQRTSIDPVDPTWNAGATAKSPPLLTPPPILTLPLAEQVTVKETVVATFAAPWALAFLPNGKILVTERPPTPANNVPSVAALRLVSQGGAVSAPLTGFPPAKGLLDVIVDPQFASNHLIYVSFFEEDPSAPRVGRDSGDLNNVPSGLAVARCVLVEDGNGSAHLDNSTVIWRQFPKIASSPGSGQPGGRMTFSPDGRYLFIAAGDRQEYEAVQSTHSPSGPFMQLSDTLGKIIRLFPDGSIPLDNPFIGVSGARPEIWSQGHRNPYGLAFDAMGQLWENEMGPKGGDELNLIEPGKNYGWPSVSYGSNYGGEDDDNPVPGDGFAPAAFWWTPVIAPSGLIFYSGTLFPSLRGDALISGLVSHGLVRVRFDGNRAQEVQRIPLGARVRAVAQGPDGAIWILEDGPNGRLARLDPG